MEHQSEHTSVIWESVDAFINDSRGVLVKSFDEQEGDEYYNIHSRAYERHIGEDVYTVSVMDSYDEETSLYEEQWMKNGQLHREGDQPAHSKTHTHFIPTETYLDESFQHFYREGARDFDRDVDSTYEDVIAHKPLSVRQAFGYDLDDDGPAP